MSGHFLALLLIFGLGHPAREPLDTAKTVPVKSRIPCDGYGAPEENVKVHATFSAGGGAREFAVSRFQNEKCSVDVHVKCLHTRKAGWHDVWSSGNSGESANVILPLGACYAWGSSEPAEYVLSGWYQDSDKKAAWHQATVKQVSSEPEVFEFTDPSGGTARLEIRR